MKLTIKLLPPYVKKGDPDEHTLGLDARSVTIEQLAGHLSLEWQGRLGYPLIDNSGLLTAEFMVNGSHASTDRLLQDGDMVTVIPYICGG